VEPEFKVFLLWQSASGRQVLSSGCRSVHCRSDAPNGSSGLKPAFGAGSGLGGEPSVRVFDPFAGIRTRAVKKVTPADAVKKIDARGFPASTPGNSRRPDAQRAMRVPARVWDHSRKKISDARDLRFRHFRLPILTPRISRREIKGSATVTLGSPLRATPAAAAFAQSPQIFFGPHQRAPRGTRWLYSGNSFGRASDHSRGSHGCLRGAEGSHVRSVMRKYPMVGCRGALGPHQ
jgi:hypothetical protein